MSWTTLRDRGERRHFVFTTTAPRRPPRTGPDILRLWHDPAHRDEVVQGIRERTQSLRDDAAEVEIALAWVDEHSAWDDFLASIAWHFEAPHFAGTRADIARHLADRALAPPLHETLTDRLLAHVLETSTCDKLEDRILTEPDLTELLELTEQNLTAWAATPRAVQLRRTLDEAAAVRSLLTPGHAELPPGAPPSKLLTARYEVVPFEEAGREQEIAQLTDWCRSSDPASVLLLHGLGGTGKTRLLIEWCRRLRHQGWQGGFLDREVENPMLSTLFVGTAPRLLVIDYGETRPALVRSVLHRLARSPETGGPKVRLALLARTAGAWWTQLQRDDPTIEDLVLASPEPVEVAALVPDPDQRPAVAARAAAAFAAARGGGAPKPPTGADYTAPRYQRALYLQVDALLQVFGEETEADRPLARILDHERRAWWPPLRELTGVQTLSASTRKAAERTLAALTLVAGAATEQEARALAQTTEAATIDHLVDLFRRLYPALDERFIAPLGPDLLGEELVRQVLANDPSLFDILLDTTTARQAHNALVIVGRLLLEDTLPIDLAKRVTAQINAEAHLPVAHRDAAVNAALRLLDHHTGHHPDSEVTVLIEQCKLINAASVRLGQVGRYEEALELAEKGVAVGRQLVNIHPIRYAPFLGLSLNTLSGQLGSLERHAAGLRAATEAVSLYRNLVAENREMFLRDLGLSLNNLSIHLQRLSRWSEATSAARAAVAIRRELADANPDLHRPDLATSLINLGGALMRLGRPEEAVAATDEAVNLSRELAKARPEVFQPELAKALSNLSVFLAALGRAEAALPAAEESAAIRRDLAAANPQIFGPDLASSLSNLSNRLAALRRWEEAVIVSKEALRILAPFFLRLPDAFASLTRTVVQIYRARCQETHTTPGQDLLAPIEEALAHLDQDDPIT